MLFVTSPILYIFTAFTGMAQGSADPLSFFIIYMPFLHDCFLNNSKSYWHIPTSSTLFTYLNLIVLFTYRHFKIILTRVILYQWQFKQYFLSFSGRSIGVTRHSSFLGGGFGRKGKSLFLKNIFT